MKRAVLIIAALAVILPAAAATVRTATESFVVSKIAEAMPGNYAAVSNAAMSALQPGEGGITSETDPTVPAWAKQSTKPDYTAAEVGAAPITGGNIANTNRLTGGAALTVWGAEGGVDEDGNWYPEGGGVAITGGGSDEPGKIDIYGAYGQGGMLTIHPPGAGGIESYYGIEIMPYLYGYGGGYIKVNGTNVMDAIAEKMDADERQGIVSEAAGYTDSATNAIWEAIGDANKYLESALGGN